MKNTELMNKITRSISMAGLKLKKHSPEILVVGGVIGVVASAVMACKATTKVNDILEETKERVDQVHKVLNDESIPEEKYSQEDSKKDLAIIYTQTGMKLAKLYGPSVVLGIMSISAILGGHNILRKRNIAIAAAYKAVDEGFKDYRKRVTDRFGEELDKELRFGTKIDKVKETVIDDNGEEKTVEKEVRVATIPWYSDYARCYTTGCKGWLKDAEMNLLTLRHMQSQCNDKLKTDGFLFLNDVYDMLGIPRTRAGQVVGWLYNEKNPSGDNYVDFGIYNLYDEAAKDFVNGYEPSIWLDFNVDGVIIDHI